MARSRSRKALGIVVSLGLAAVAGATVVTLIGRDGDDDSQPSDGPDLISVPRSRSVRWRSTSRSPEPSTTTGSVTLTAHTSGVLTRPRARGDRRDSGESRLYRIINDPTEADTADVLGSAGIGPKARSWRHARSLSDAAGGAVRVRRRRGARRADRCPRGAATVSSSPRLRPRLPAPSRSVATASEALDRSCWIRARRCSPKPGREALIGPVGSGSDLLAGASQAEVDSARAALAAAEADLADLREGASQAEVDSARGSLLAAAEADLADLRDGCASQAEVDSARS